MSDEFKGTVGNPAAAQTPAPAAGGASGVQSGGQPAPAAQPAGGTVDFSTTKHKVKIDGNELEVPYTELVAGYQLREASNKRFEEASRREKESELYRQAVTELNEIIEKKDYKKFMDVFGEDFVKELPATGGAATGKAGSYNVEDKRLADSLGIPVEEFVAKKAQAFGLDNPQIPEIQKQLNTLMEENKQLKGHVLGLARKTEVDKLESAFMDVAGKYPDVDKFRALDIIERERRNPKDFELVFKTLQEQEDKRLEERYNRRVEEKRKAASGFVGGVNTMETPEFNEDEFKGKNFNERMALLIKKSQK